MAHENHEFVVLRNGQFETYTRYEDIPLDFDHVIKFKPDIAPDPHTEDQHNDIAVWNSRLQALMQIERNKVNQQVTQPTKYE